MHVPPRHDAASSSSHFRRVRSIALISLVLPLFLSLVLAPSPSGSAVAAVVPLPAHRQFGSHFGLSSSQWRPQTGAFRMEATNVTCPEEEEVPFWEPWTQFPSYLKLAGALVCLAFSGLFSGLTLGLLGLDKVTLEILRDSGSPAQKRHAQIILPVRERGNLLLCTLLLGNVCVNSGISILTSDLFNGMIGFFSSSIMITLFGEIIPQSICSRHGLMIGAYTAWFVKIMMVVLFPVAYPLSFILDKALGAEMGTIYTKRELKKLIELHATHQAKSGLGKSEAAILGGALEYREKRVQSIMTPISEVFMLEISEKLDVDTMTKLWESGHSRVPVYRTDRHSIIGILYTKDLILLNPEDAIPLQTIVSFYGHEVTRVFEDTQLEDVLSIFKTGRTHIAIVQRVNNEGGGDPFYETLGIVTLEDVIEEIIQDEIADEYETDSKRGSQRNTRRGNNMFSKRGKESRLSPAQINAASSYLTQTVPPFQLLSSGCLHRLLYHSSVTEVTRKEDQETFIYQRDVPSSFFTLILNGKIEVISGTDEFKSENGPWSFLGVRALTDPEFCPDFSARVLSNTRILRISRNDFVYALDDTLEGRKIPEGFNWIEPIIAERRARKILKAKQTTSSPVSPITSDAAPTSSQSSNSNQTNNSNESEVELQEIRTQFVETSTQPTDVVSVQMSVPSPQAEGQELEKCDHEDENVNVPPAQLHHQTVSSHLIVQIAEGSGYDEDPNAYIQTTTAIHSLERPDDLC